MYNLGETVTNSHQLKFRAAGGKIRLTDITDTELLFRLVQSIPSPKASGVCPHDYCGCSATTGDAYLSKNTDELTNLEWNKETRTKFANRKLGRARVLFLVLFYATYSVFYVIICFLAKISLYLHTKRLKMIDFY